MIESEQLTENRGQHGVPPDAVNVAQMGAASPQFVVMIDVFGIMERR